ncbi:MAG: YjbQ family protein [Candidatus Riflebacteria bacterium]|nr:YjbQ family protein [Candidatus Riflebacteria bacterium]
MIFEYSVKTDRAQQLVDVTAKVADAVKKSGKKEAHVLISVPHTTCAMTINENCDPAVPSDLLRRLEKIVPVHDPEDRHAEGNSAAHLKSSLVGFSVMMPVSDGGLLLGTWQGIYLCEFDGPRTRRLVVSII